MRSFQPRVLGMHRRQKGVTLIIAMIAIVSMVFAVYAMLRSTSGSQAVAGNLAFKKNATSAGDLGLEAARSWLVSRTAATLYANQSPGYFATWDTTFNPITYGWSAGTNAILVTNDDGMGNRVMYVVHRLCSLAGALTLANQNCVRPSGLSSVSVGVGTGGGGTDPVISAPSAYFRVTTRIEGPRNTLSYVQAIMY
jgi:type IV pilus assembly protein PilX